MNKRRGKDGMPLIGQKPKHSGRTADRPTLSFDLYDLVFIFFAGGTLGTAYEVLQYLLINGVLEDRRGSILTPVNYVYGLGAVLIFLAMVRIRRPVCVFSLGALLGGTLEYTLSVMQEGLLGSRSWDYSARPLNIGGRTTVPYMLVWGVLCCLSMHFAFPFLLHRTRGIPSNVKRNLTIALLLLIALDLLVTLPAVVRYAQRSADVAACGRLDRLIDRLFPDTYMQRHFPNMCFR